MSFQVGDRVVCVDDSPHWSMPDRGKIVAGKEYVVAEVNHHDDEIRLDGNENDWRVNRFRFLAHGEDPQYAELSALRAKAEAFDMLERLLNPGGTLHIIRVLKSADGTYAVALGKGPGEGANIARANTLPLALAAAVEQMEKTT